MSEKEFDEAALKSLVAVRAGFEHRWSEGTNAILKERNPELLSELTRLESVLDSLIQIKVKPKPLQKQFKDSLDRYTVIANDCINYADRHINRKI